ncbi:DNA cytosine methyltransferase [Streptomyces scopuliridis]|uniref:DNA cytosine methyltransferase n=1 Tax=Streptomyces scopuliridis TaxID=452529 RepID=UPI003438D4FA
MSGPRIGSVCTGYGGLDMAVQAVFGGTLAWVADNDPGASRILAHHMPRVPNLGDITAVDWHDVEPVDIYIGGYPCQPFSTAGKRKGARDDRHIWPDIARALGVLRPRLAVFENVAGHLSLGFDTVLCDLAALGFDAEWRCVKASDIGAAHQRKRLIFLAWPADTGGEGLARRWAERTTAHRRGLAAADAFDVGGDRGGARGAGWDEPAARRLAAADPQGVGEREQADETDAVAGSRDTRQVPGRRSLRTAADPGGSDMARQPVPDPGRDGPAVTALGDGADWGRYAPAIERWTQVIGRPAPRPVDDMGRLNPPLVEWLMGLDAGHVTGVPGLSRTAQLKALGNGVMPQQATAALRLLTAAVDSGHGRPVPERAA